MLPVWKATWETKLQPESGLVSLELERIVGQKQVMLMASGMNPGRKDKDCLKDSEWRHASSSVSFFLLPFVTTTNYLTYSFLKVPWLQLSHGLGPLCVPDNWSTKASILVGILPHGNCTSCSKPGVYPSSMTKLRSYVLSLQAQGCSINGWTERCLQSFPALLWSWHP